MLTDDHLSFEMLAGYTDGELDDVAKEIADVHLQRCDTCSTELADLRVLAVELDTERSATPLSDGTHGFWPHFRWRPSPIWALTAATLIVAISLGFWLLRPPDAIELGEGIPPVGVEGPVVSDPPEQSVADQEMPAAVISLIDGGRRIEVDAAGRLIGFDDPQFARTLTAALTRGEAAIANDTRRLRQSAGVLMGAGQTGVPFALVSPVGKVIETTQPTLRWRPLANAESYRVEVFSEAFEKVASSGVTPRNSWQVNVPLRRGAVYRWQVTAVVDGEEVRSPTRPAPGARFKVIDARSSKRISDARASGSHLALALAYAEAGLLDEAERAMRIVIRNNPDLATVRKVLEKILAGR